MKKLFVILIASLCFIGVKAQQDINISQSQAWDIVDREDLKQEGDYIIVITGCLGGTVHEIIIHVYWVAGAPYMFAAGSTELCQMNGSGNCLPIDCGDHLHLSITEDVSPEIVSIE